MKISVRIFSDNLVAVKIYLYFFTLVLPLYNAHHTAERTKTRKLADRRVMERSLSILVWSLIVLLPLYVLHICRRWRSGSNRLPPGPAGWPVVGHMFSLGEMPHRTLAGLKEKYGPVVWLKLGSHDTMVVLTAAAATELFKHHDVSFAGRTIRETMRSHDYHKGSLALSQYGKHWRVLRRICTLEMLVNRRLNETVSIREKCVKDMLSRIEKESHAAKGKGEIHVTRIVFFTLFNMLGNSMVSRDMVGPDSKEGSDFYNALIALKEWSGRPNVSDLFPCLRWLDLQGLRKKMDRDMGELLRIGFVLVKERLEERQGGGEKRKDFLDVLLDFEGSRENEPAKISEKDIAIFILELFQAGGETTSTTIEWAMTELLRNPEAMAVTKAELAKVIGPNRNFQESDIDSLPYLQAVVKETLRLHPPIPFLVPRKAIQDANFMGYHIPKNTQVFVNAWAIGRDPEYWDDPSAFKPERFLGSKIDYKGQNFEFIPFGAGRRMCAGIPLAHRMLHSILGSLLYAFDWELGGDVICETMDMRDKMGGLVEGIKASEPRDTLKLYVNRVLNASGHAGQRRKAGSNRLPPGQPGWPVFGHMFNLGTMPHRATAGFIQQYGPILWLKLGSNNTTVIQTAATAAEFFKNHDLSFMDRMIKETMRSHDYHKNSLALAPYGTHWHFLRRMCTVEMFVTKRINETVSIRRKSVNDMVLRIEKELHLMDEGRGVHVNRFVFFCLFNMLGNLILSRDLVDPDSEEGSDFYTTMELFSAGSETASTTVEWAMTELLCNPDTMFNVKAELAKVVGPTMKFEESDINDLQYLQVVVKETLRLHPPVPFLIPRKTIHDTSFMGYDIPKGVSLAHGMLHYILDSLLHEFDWELESHVTRETMDMTDRIGVAVRKFEPLKAVPRRSTQ
ncbi:hypothetical protein RJ639_016806, partial [Escallonia herrerae]